MTDEQSDQPEQNPGRTRRAVNFIARRGGINRAFEGTRKGAEFIGDITNRLRPRWFDRKGLTGRYSDGGITRFQNLTDGMSEFELGDQYRGWLMQRACFQYATLGAVLAIPLGFVFFQMSKFFIFGLIGLFLFALFRAIRADFFAWILEQGRFGGFLDYLGSRLPRNVQVILPERHRGTPNTTGGGKQS
jgi:hypothetical protein